MNPYIPTLRDYQRLQELYNKVIQDNQALRITVDALFNQLEEAQRDIYKLTGDNIIDAEIDYFKLVNIS